MHTQKEALIILNCSKMTLSRYVKEGKLERVKNGRRTYYDEHEVAVLVKEIENKRSKYRTDLPKREKKRIELPAEVKEVCRNIASADNLTKVGYEYLAETTSYLQKLNLYEECDKEIIVLYALSVQMYHKYLHLATEAQCTFVSDTGAITLHPYFKVLQHHEKMMLAYGDRLGLNPLARQKLELKKDNRTEKEKQEQELMDSILFGDD
ncbi:P27 family phage terminase small subunit [Sulfurimonas sp. NW15]|uniref:P27 family phage terminase small subunit n=1 Tax=Sulfurimonas TaxID=202746 RepID=UPI00125F004C|nr:P27 family phage terminase small subunit [Sulfurimonas hydrogeniphila]